MVKDCQPDCDERADCPDAGTSGHYDCGRCACGMPNHHWCACKEAARLARLA